MTTAKDYTGWRLVIALRWLADRIDPYTTGRYRWERKVMEEEKSA
jgi:hypothetical protein